MPWRFPSWDGLNNSTEDRNITGIEIGTCGIWNFTKIAFHVNSNFKKNISEV
jgi:hypothetical protein